MYTSITLDRHYHHVLVAGKLSKEFSPGVAVVNDWADSHTWVQVLTSRRL